MTLNENVGQHSRVPVMEKEDAQTHSLHNSEDNGLNTEKSARISDPDNISDDLEPIVTLKTWVVCVVSIEFQMRMKLSLVLLTVKVRFYQLAMVSRFGLSRSWRRLEA